MFPSILVLGALGNVGAEVVNCLQASGVPVRAGDLFPENMRQRFGETTGCASFDFSKPETFTPAFQGIERVFLMRPPQIADVKKFMFPAIDAAKAAGVRQVVFLSLIEIEQNKIAPHYKVEQYLKKSGLGSTFLRCSFFMQNLNTTHLAEIRDRDEIYIPVGKARTSFIDVRDIGAVAAAALTQPGHENQAYDLTGGEALDYFQVASLFSHVLGRKITYKNPSSLAFFFRQLRKRHLGYALVTTWLYSNTRKGMAARVTGEVRRLTGREPIPMRQYIEDYRQSWEKTVKSTAPAMNYAK
ncbi:MAG: SDR family oxidoreductase [Chloroflexi bacterium]|nr:MAG: SDR family oxidoreductase [Chloroflexota bacterium]